MTTTDAGRALRQPAADVERQGAHVAAAGAVGPVRDHRDARRRRPAVAASSPPAASSWPTRTFSISFSAARSFSTMSLTRSGSSSGRTLSASESWATSTCSRARNW